MLNSLKTKKRRSAKRKKSWRPSKIKCKRMRRIKKRRKAKNRSRARLSKFSMSTPKKLKNLRNNTNSFLKCNAREADLQDTLDLDFSS
jgi:hypothetical protein